MSDSLRFDAASALALLGALTASAVSLWLPPDATLPGSAALFTASLSLVTWGGALCVALDRRALALACALALAVVGIWQTELWSVVFPPAAASVAALELRDRLGA